MLSYLENDFSFANVKYGSPVPYGNAGDCYSSDPNCQQVHQFFLIFLLFINELLKKAFSLI